MLKCEGVTFALKNPLVYDAHRLCFRTLFYMLISESLCKRERVRDKKRIMTIGRHYSKQKGAEFKGKEVWANESDKAESWVAAFPFGNKILKFLTGAARCYVVLDLFRKAVRDVWFGLWPIKKAKF